MDSDMDRNFAGALAGCGSSVDRDLSGNTHVPGKEMAGMTSTGGILAGSHGVESPGSKDVHHRGAGASDVDGGGGISRSPDSDQAPETAPEDGEIECSQCEDVAGSEDDGSGGEGGAEGEFQVLTFVVEPPFGGWRVDRYLCHKLPRLSRTKAQRLIRGGLVSDRPLKPSSPVTPGMVLTMKRRREDEPPTPTNLEVLFRDEDVTVFDKPSGLPIHATARYLHGTLIALARKMARPGEKPDPAHRLDRETSGIVVCGNHIGATRKLKAAFAQGLVHKRYVAITQGWPEEDEFEVDAPLSVGGEVVRVRVMIDRENGKPSKTRFRVLERKEWNGERFALVECSPVTGRQHQIRVHLSSVGYPIVGDKIYGPDERIFARFAEYRLTDEDKRILRLPRHALHACHIELPHPSDGRIFSVDAPLPEDMHRFFYEGELDQFQGENWKPPS